VVIINKGRVVAVDTPANLTARLKGNDAIYLQVDAGGADPEPALRAIAGVVRVARADGPGPALSYEVECEQDQDLRRDIARAVVKAGWGLLELRPLRMSLEEIFLSLTTEETPPTEVANG
jgi:ABC-2 type transport system ATP-binding protein